MIDMVIPTGAMGNLTGGYMAKQLGVPIGRLCAGVNINGEKHHLNIVILGEHGQVDAPHLLVRFRHYSQGDRER